MQIDTSHSSWAHAKRRLHQLNPMSATLLASRSHESAWWSRHIMAASKVVWAMLHVHFNGTW